MSAKQQVQGFGADYKYPFHPDFPAAFEMSERTIASDLHV
jgi:hypothetical protein